VILVNGVSDAHSGETVDQLLVRLDVDPRGVAVAIDGDVVTRSSWSVTVVPDGSSVEVVTAAAGG
jgi:sulfur carrier protein